VHWEGVFLAKELHFTHFSVLKN